MWLNIRHNKYIRSKFVDLTEIHNGDVCWFLMMKYF